MHSNFSIKILMNFYKKVITIVSEIYKLVEGEAKMQAIHK